MAEFTLQELHDEIEVDPLALGYKTGAVWKSDAEIAGLINALDGPGAAVIMRKLIEPAELWTSIPYTEYELYGEAKREWLDTALELAGGTGIIDGNDPVVFANLLAVFPAGSEARANILAKIQRVGSRAEVLWGEATVVTISNVAYASNL